MWVKVTSADKENGKMSLSMKLVDQGTGKDKDPDNAEAERMVRSGYGGTPHTNPASRHAYRAVTRQHANHACQAKRPSLSTPF